MKNKKVIETLTTLLFFAIVIVGIIAFIYFSNFRKETCINKGGQVIENVIGIYDKCIYGSDKVE